MVMVFTKWPPDYTQEAHTRGARKPYSRMSFLALTSQPRSYAWIALVELTIEWEKGTCQVYRCTFMR
jgi:hypothetical protein